MPAFDLSVPVSAPLHAVVGTWDEQTNAVNHVALIAIPTVLGGTQDPVVTHMGPPFGDSELQNARLLAFVRLTEQQEMAISDWITDVKTRIHPRLDYVGTPSHALIPDENGRGLYWRFSCSGFVVRAYQEAGLNLVAEEPALPLVGKALLHSVWQHVFSHMQPGPVRDRAVSFKMRQWGFTGEGPWRVLLPGYIFHALNQPCPRWPYVPTGVEEVAVVL